jgi:hypothetical protein
VRTGPFGHAPTRGQEAKLFLALLPQVNGETVRARPSQQTFTIATGGGATATLTLTTALTTTVVAGQFLRFTNTTTGGEFIVQVKTTASSGTAIEIETAVPGGGIPDGAVCEFPLYIWDRTELSVEGSLNRSSVATYNTGGFEDGVVTGGSFTMSAPGIWYSKNAALLTCLWASTRGRELWAQRVVGSQFTEGPVVVTATSSGAASDAFVSSDLTFAFQGQPSQTLL